MGDFDMVREKLFRHVQKFSRASRWEIEEKAMQSGPLPVRSRVKTPLIEVNNIPATHL